MRACHAVALSLALLGACEPGAPDDPTYFGDVQEILNANCARCHGADPSEEEIAGFRLDRYVKNDEATLDAWDFRDAIVAHAVDLDEPAMPPRYVLSQRQRNTLVHWVDNGAPKGERDDAAPRAELLEPSGAMVEVDQSLDVMVRAWDDDGDGLVVSLVARPDTPGADQVLVTGLGAGMRAAQLDTGALSSKQHFALIAIVDDGYSDEPADNATEVVLIEDMFVDHGDLGTAPTVELLEPNGGTTILGPTAITWSASDADGDPLAIDLELVRVHADATETVEAQLATGLPNAPSSWQWDPAGVPTEEAGTPIDYKIRVTVTDGQNSRSDESDTTFTIASEGGPTGLTWADLKPLFATYCIECHGEPAKTPAIDYFRVDKYDAADPVPPINSDDGVYETRATIYDRAVVRMNMPPNGKPQPTAAELADLSDWILAGAPP